MSQAQFLKAIREDDYEIMAELADEQDPATLRKAAFMLIDMAVDLQIEWKDHENILDQMKLLVRRGLKVDEKLMSRAMDLKGKDIVRLFIKNGSKFSGPQLFNAIRYDESVKFVIDHASLAAIDFRDRYGNRALHIAAKYTNADAVRHLIKAGAKINTRNKLKETPLHLAYKNGFSAGISMLEKAGAQQGYRDVHGKVARDYSGLMQGVGTFLAGLPFVGHRASPPSRSKRRSASKRTPSRRTPPKRSLTTRQARTSPGRMRYTASKRWSQFRAPTHAPPTRSPFRARTQ